MKMGLIPPFDITRSDIKLPRDQRREAIRILHCAAQGLPIDGYFDPAGASREPGLFGDFDPLGAIDNCARCRVAQQPGWNVRPVRAVDLYANESVSGASVMREVLP
jgi:hypothetical protein